MRRSAKRSCIDYYFIFSTAGLAIFFSLAFTEKYPDRAFIKSQFLAERIDQKTLIGEMHVLWAVGENDKGRRPAGNLRGIEKFYPPAAVQRWGMFFCRFLEDPVQAVGWKSLAVLLVYPVNCRKEFFGAGTGKG